MFSTPSLHPAYFPTRCFRHHFGCIRILLDVSKATTKLNLMLVGRAHHIGMPLKLTLADEKRQPAAPPPPPSRKARRVQVSRREGLRVAASVVVAFCLAA